MTTKPKIGILGCGWLGSRLASSLANQYSIYTTVTSIEKKAVLEHLGYHVTLISFANESKQVLEKWKHIDEFDALVITVPFSERMSTKAALICKFQNMIAFLGSFQGRVFFMSSTGVYPATNKVFHEDDLPVNQVWTEQLVREKFPQTTILRLGGLMGDNRLLSNYQISDLEAPVNHIHYTDISAVLQQMLQVKIEKEVFNVVAPMHPSKAAVVHEQKNLYFNELMSPKGRIISSDKLIAALHFTFTYPDPRFFHLAS